VGLHLGEGLIDMTGILPPLEPPYSNGPPPGYYFAPIPQPLPPKPKTNGWLLFFGAIGAFTVAIVVLGGVNAFLHSQGIANPPKYQLGAYPAVFEQSFLNGCEGKGGTSSQCTCALNWVERNMSIDQAVNEGNAFTRTGAVTPEMTEAGQACVGA
jgi:hypothetical protein